MILSLQQPGKKRLLPLALLVLSLLAPPVDGLAQGRRGNTPSPEDIRKQYEKMQEKERSREARPYERDHSNIHGPLKEIITRLGSCTVRVFCDGQKRALGTVVSKRGEVLTKAS